MSSCPVCGRSEMSLRFEVHPSRHLGLHEVYKLLRCPQCHFQGAFPRPDAATLRKVYGASFFNTIQQHVPLDPDGRIAAQSETRAILRNARGRVRWLTRWRDGGRLLDVGCGKGVFVYAAGRSFEAEGIDLSPHAVEWGQQRGLRLRCADFAAQDFLPEGAFDVVTMWDVLGSLPEPRAALDRVAKLLTPQGIFVASFPDPDSWPSRLLGRRWPLMIPPVNISFPTRKTLAVLADKCGFRLRYYGRRGKLVDIRFVVRKLKRTLGLKVPDPSDAEAGRGYNIYLNLWDIATALLEKTESQ